MRRDLVTKAAHFTELFPHLYPFFIFVYLLLFSLGKMFMTCLTISQEMKLLFTKVYTVEQNTHVLGLVDTLFLVQKLYMAIVMYFAS